MSYFVFSDVDETLIGCKSMVAFMMDFLFFSDYAKSSDLSEKTKEFNALIELSKDPKISREVLNKRFYRMFEGIPQAVMEKSSSSWVSDKINQGDFFVNRVLFDYQQHQRNGAKLILISGSFREILTPIKIYVKADYLICSELEVENGFYTGRILKQVIGNGKWNCIQDYIYGKNVELSSCYAYGDHESDICFMEKVGHPVLVGGSKSMQDYAKRNNWDIIPH